VIPDVDVVVPPELRSLRGPVAVLAGAVLEIEDFTDPVVVALVDEPAISELNQRYRGLAGSTDVLAFRYADGEDSWPGEQDVPAGGEVAVCPAVVRRYSDEEGDDPGRRLAWTIIHGVLHLLGYDHETDEGEMRQREQELLRELGPLVRAVSVQSEG
jgi:probable rRNA maturation factor